MNPRKASLRAWSADLAALFLPRRCAGCDGMLMRFEEHLCTVCLSDLPRTRHHLDAANPVAQLFWGKVELQAAAGFLFFRRDGMVQRMLHRLKYAQDRGTGELLGRLMAEEIAGCAPFDAVDTYLPVPLHPSKERARGYNQSRVLVDGMCTVRRLPVAGNDLMRVVRTPSQTRRGRLDRWLNVKEAFHLPDPTALRGRHVLLVDDVVTTGATLEGCARALAQVPDIRISVYTAACA